MRAAVVAGGIYMNVRYISAREGHYPGYDVYIDGVFVGWTAGTMTDARAFAKSITSDKAKWEAEKKYAKGEGQ